MNPDLIARTFGEEEARLLKIKRAPFDYFIDLSNNARIVKERRWGPFFKVIGIDITRPTGYVITGILFRNSIIYMQTEYARKR
ncbi:MAG: hypothetical protein AABW79_02485 [Nanoarchaeota archaeon]